MIDKIGYDRDPLDKGFDDGDAVEDIVEERIYHAEGKENHIDERAVEEDDLLSLLDDEEEKRLEAQQEQVAVPEQGYDPLLQAASMFEKQLPVNPLASRDSPINYKTELLISCLAAGMADAIEYDFTKIDAGNIDTVRDSLGIIGLTKIAQEMCVPKRLVSDISFEAAAANIGSFLSKQLSETANLGIITDEEKEEKEKRDEQLFSYRKGFAMHLGINPDALVAGSQYLKLVDGLESKIQYAPDISSLADIITLNSVLNYLRKQVDKPILQGIAQALMLQYNDHAIFGKTDILPNDAALALLVASETGARPREILLGIQSYKTLNLKKKKILEQIAAEAEAYSSNDSVYDNLSQEIIKDIAKEFGIYLPIGSVLYDEYEYDNWKGSLADEIIDGYVEDPDNASFKRGDYFMIKANLGEGKQFKQGKEANTTIDKHPIGTVGTIRGSIAGGTFSVELNGEGEYYLARDEIMKLTKRFTDSTGITGFSDNDEVRIVKAIGHRSGNRPDDYYFGGTTTKIPLGTKGHIGEVKNDEQYYVINKIDEWHCHPKELINYTALNNFISYLKAQDKDNTQKIWRAIYLKGDKVIEKDKEDFSEGVGTVVRRRKGKVDVMFDDGTIKRLSPLNIEYAEMPERIVRLMQEKEGEMQQYIEQEKEELLHSANERLPGIIERAESRFKSYKDNLLTRLAESINGLRTLGVSDLIISYVLREKYEEKLDDVIGEDHPQLNKLLSGATFIDQLRELSDGISYRQIKDSIISELGERLKTDIKLNNRIDSKEDLEHFIEKLPDAVRDLIVKTNVIREIIPVIGSGQRVTVIKNLGVGGEYKYGDCTTHELKIGAEVTLEDMCGYGKYEYYHVHIGGRERHLHKDEIALADAVKDAKKLVEEKVPVLFNTDAPAEMKCGATVRIKENSRYFAEYKAQGAVGVMERDFDLDCDTILTFPDKTRSGYIRKSHLELYGVEYAKLPLEERQRIDGYVAELTNTVRNIAAEKQKEFSTKRDSAVNLANSAIHELLTLGYSMERVEEIFDNEIGSSVLDEVLF